MQQVRHRDAEPEPRRPLSDIAFLQQPSSASLGTVQLAKEAPAKAPARQKESEELQVEPAVPLGTALPRPGPSGQPGHTPGALLQAASAQLHPSGPGQVKHHSSTMCTASDADPGCAACTLMVHLQQQLPALEAVL